MSARIGVWQAKWSRDWWWQCDDPDDPMPGCPAKRSYGIEFSLAAAADAGRAHLAEHHAQEITPIVQTVVLSTRCTCGDLPRNAYPYFSPCPVHSYLVNTFTTTNAPTQGYCRLHGVHRGVCGCRVASVDPDAENGPENGSDAIADQCGCTPRDPHSIHDTHDNPLQTTHNESREGC